MVLPRWLLVTVAAAMLAFGLYRVYLGIRQLSGKKATEAAAPPRVRGFYGRSASAHLMFGFIYFLMAGYVLLTSFGYGMTSQGCRGPDQTSLPTG